MRRLAALAALVAAAIPCIARADDTTVARRAADARERGLPYTEAELTTGFLLLPGASVCQTPNDPTSCNRGEFSFAAGLQNIYRIGPFGVGAGLGWAHTLRSDAAVGDPSLQREHSRSYFMVEAIGRYYFLKSKSWDFWAGLTVGLVVLNDTWTTDADRNPYEMTANIGPQTGVLGSEGLTLGANLGGEWTFATNWSVGPTLRYCNWFLPRTPKTTPTLDSASLAGRLDVIDVAVRMTYRIAL